jgi:hypothetical protein
MSSLRLGALDLDMINIFDDDSGEDHDYNTFVKRG